MSHWTEIKTQIKDVESLIAGAKKLGMTVECAKIGTTLPVSTPFGTRDCAIRLTHPAHNRYQIGARREVDGTFSLHVDWYGGIAQVVGSKINGIPQLNFDRLIQAYGVAKATAEAKAKGWFVKRENRADGTVKLIVTGMR